MVDYINSIESKLNDFIRSNLDEIFGDSNSPITIKLLSDFSISNYLKKNKSVQICIYRSCK